MTDQRRTNDGAMTAERSPESLRTVWLTFTRLPAMAARALIRAYQLVLSPFIGNQCRFHPSCSNYALEAVEAYGALRGSWLAAKRLGRCHPFNPGGFDPVPGTGFCTSCINGSADSTNENPEFSPGAKEI